MDGTPEIFDAREVFALSQSGMSPMLWVVPAAGTSRCAKAFP
jgi:hypothetical protein